MNIEQVEAQLSEFEHDTISVIVPIRGTVVLTFCGKLIIKHDWENHIILYSAGEVCFQAPDVERIIEHSGLLIDATVMLKSDAPMEKSKLTHA